MGLLDSPENAALLQLGMGLLSAGGPSRMPVSLGQAIGSAGGQAMDAYRQTEAWNAQKRARELQQQMMDMQLGEAQRKAQAIQGVRNQLPEQLRGVFDLDPVGFLKQMNKEEEAYTLTPGSARFKGGQKVAEIPAAPKEQSLPWYVRKSEDGRMQIDPAYAELEKTKASFGRPPAQPMAPVAYVDDKGQTVWGTITDARGRPAANFNPTIQGAVAQAKGAGKTYGEETTKAALDYSRIAQNAETALKLADDLIKHPGFAQAVGASSMLGIQKIPGTNARDFMNRLDQIKGGAFLEAFNSLKGGGQITEIEGKKATDAIARMDNATSEGEFKAAVKDYQDIIRKGAGRAKMKANPVAPIAPAVPSGGAKFLGFE